MRATVAPSSVAMRYATAVQLLLADQWLADRGADGRWVATLARSWFLGPARRATAQLEGLGVSLPALVGFESRQVALEERWPHPEVAASPTAAVLAMAFEAAAQLPGAAPAFADRSARAGLAELGASIGAGIYLLDALEDLGKDARTGDFNPCLDPDGRVCATRRSDAVTALREALASAQRICDTLPWARHAQVLRAVLRRFCARSRAAIERAHEPDRDVPRVAAAWAWGLSSAAPDVRTDLPADLGPDAARDVGPGSPDELAIDEPARGGCSACDGCGQACSSGCEACVQGFEDCFTGCATCVTDCGRACEGCGRCPDACCDSGSGCCDACGGCGQGCNECGQGCGGCGQGCQGC